MNNKKAIKKALDLAVRYGGNDGAHHKDWVIDQMVRALTGCPTTRMVNKSAVGGPHAYEGQGESDEYRELVREAMAGEDGPGTYSWEIGIAP